MVGTIDVGTVGTIDVGTVGTIDVGTVGTIDVGCCRRTNTVSSSLIVAPLTVTVARFVIDVPGVTVALTRTRIFNTIGLLGETGPLHSIGLAALHTAGPKNVTLTNVNPTGKVSRITTLRWVAPSPLSRNATVTTNVNSSPGSTCDAVLTFETTIG